MGGVAAAPVGGDVRGLGFLWKFRSPTSGASSPHWAMLRISGLSRLCPWWKGTLRGGGFGVGCTLWCPAPRPAAQPGIGVLQFSCVFADPVGIPLSCGWGGLKHGSLGFAFSRLPGCSPGLWGAAAAGAWLKGGFQTSLSLLHS